jgi:Uncharacterized membrane-anchored protein
MFNKKILFPIFLLIAFVQLYVPAKMVLDREDVLNKGTEYKFKSRPIDPTDLFREKYITLSYEENRVEVPNDRDWMRGEIVYVYLTTDSAGFAKIKSVSKEKLNNNQDYLKTKINYVSDRGPTKLTILTIDYPFNRYYMEESKAYEAEKAYRRSGRDTNQIAYSLVSIKDGEAALKEVFIDGVPIKEVVLKNREQPNE